MASSAQSKDTKKDCLIGVLVDVSGSMKKALELGFSAGKSHMLHPAYEAASLDCKSGSASPQNESLNRIHAIYTILKSILDKKFEANNENDRVFVGAFGLKKVHTCDLLSLLQCVSKSITPRDCRGLQVYATVEELKNAREDKITIFNNGYNNLIKVAEGHRIYHAKKWIKLCLTELEAGVLCTLLSYAENLTRLFVKMFNSEDIKKFSGSTSYAVSAGDVKKTGPYKFTIRVIHLYAKVTAHLQAVQKPKPQPIREALDILEKQVQNMGKGDEQHREFHRERQTKTRLDDPLLTFGAFAIGASRGLNEKREAVERLKKLDFESWSNTFEYIEPFIYGRTPMVQCMTLAKNNFSQTRASNKVLFILSDGESTDGDPVPVGQHLLDSGVTIITCFLTESEISNSKCLIDRKNCTMTKGAAALFDISSIVPNNEAPVRVLHREGWVIPLSGVSRLFFQANSMEDVEKLCNIIFTSIKDGTYLDSLIDIMGTIKLADYINSSISEFKPNEQDGATCYANAIAAVYYLAMNRIVVRKGGIPTFNTILKQLVDLYGKKGAFVDEVMHATCKKYRLKYHHLDNENKAREAINSSHPLVVIYRWNKSQIQKFDSFFTNDRTRKGILEAEDIKGLLFKYFFIQYITPTY